VGIWRIPVIGPHRYPLIELATFCARFRPTKRSSRFSNLEDLSVQFPSAIGRNL
jgi:hypothetical protein